MPIELWTSSWSESCSGAATGSAGVLPATRMLTGESLFTAERAETAEARFLQIRFLNLRRGVLGGKLTESGAKH